MYDINRSDILIADVKLVSDEEEWLLTYGLQVAPFYDLLGYVPWSGQQCDTKTRQGGRKPSQSTVRQVSQVGKTGYKIFVLIYKL